MNKLLLNNTARNHIKIFPMPDTFSDIPEDNAGKIKWCEEKFKSLQHSSNATRLFIVKHKAKGYLISVWEFDGLYYLVQCLRNEFKTFNDTIYISKNKDDMISIAKFLQQNIDQIMKDYRNQILEARDALLREQSKVVDEQDAADA